MQEFLSMGGYAGYVWSAFGITAAAMIVVALFARHSDRRALDRIRKEERHKQ